MYYIYTQSTKNFHIYCIILFLKKKVQAALTALDLL